MACATAEPLTIPLPPGAVAPLVAPSPEWGGPPAWFFLGGTHSHKLRKARFDPETCRLEVVTAAVPHGKQTPAEYDVAERACDGGRSFVCAKVGRPDRLHAVYAGPDGVSCSCEGHTYITSAKANQRAWDAGDEVYPTYGCVHADALVGLLRAGWFDLNPPASAALAENDGT